MPISPVIARNTEVPHHCEEGQSPSETISYSMRVEVSYNCANCFVIARSAEGLPSPPSLRGVPKARRSNLFAWFPHAQLLPMFVIARKGVSLDEAISLFPYFWNSHTIAPQLPEIATGHYRGPRNDKWGNDCHGP